MAYDTTEPTTIRPSQNPEWWSEGIAEPGAYESARHIAPRAGDRIYITRERVRLVRSADSDEKVEIIDVVDVAPVAQNP